MTAFGALQPMAAGFAAGSDLAGTSGAGIARSCPKAALFLLPKETRILLCSRGANSDQIFLDIPGPQIWISHEPVADPIRHCEFNKLAVAAGFF
jgi:hypothetical protein